MALPNLQKPTQYPNTPTGSTITGSGVDMAYAALNHLNSLPQYVAPPSAPTTQPTTTAGAGSAQATADAQKRTNLLNQIQVGLEGIQQGGSTTLRDVGNTYATNSRNAVQGIQSSQDAINRARENTALNLRRGMSGITDSIRQGLRSGSVQLANMNASDSGASEALARAYARLGNQQSGDIRNQAFTQNRETDFQQKSLDQQEQNALADFAIYRATEMDRVSNDLYNQLRVLDSNASAEGAKGKVDFGLRDRLINEAIARLNQIDQQTTQQLSGVNPLSQDQISATAAQLDTAGATGGSPFSVDQIGAPQVTPSPAYSSVGQLPIRFRRNE